MAVKAEEGLGEANFLGASWLGSPAGETGASGASPGCHLSRSILDGRFRDLKNCGWGHGTKEGATAGVDSAT